MITNQRKTTNNKLFEEIVDVWNVIRKFNCYTKKIEKKMSTKLPVSMLQKQRKPNNIYLCAVLQKEMNETSL